jgi:hypothetical protein
MSKDTKKQYEDFLNEIGITEDDKKSNGGRISDHYKYGTWLRRNDCIAFECGFSDYKNN